MNLLAIIDHYTFRDSYLEVAKKCAPYASMIWYRIKACEASEIFSRAAAMRNMLKDSVLILSERGDIACACGFDGVHLGKGSIQPKVIKKIYPGLKTGFSAHSPEECLAVQADYHTLSPIFPTPKDYKVRPLGAIASPAKNVYALGGINRKNYFLLKGLNYAGIAGIRLCLDTDFLSRL